MKGVCCAANWSQLFCFASVNSYESSHWQDTMIIDERAIVFYFRERIESLQNLTCSKVLHKLDLWPHCVHLFLILPVATCSIHAIFYLSSRCILGLTLRL